MVRAETYDEATNMYFYLWQYVEGGVLSYCCRWHHKDLLPFYVRANI